MKHEDARSNEDYRVVALQYRNRIAELEAERKRTTLVIALLLQNYLDAYEGNRDRLATEAEKLVPDWKRIAQDEWFEILEEGK